MSGHCLYIFNSVLKERQSQAYLGEKLSFVVVQILDGLSIFRWG
jgi:hypothetical protein